MWIPMAVVYCIINKSKEVIQDKNIAKELFG